MIVPLVTGAAFIAGMLRYDIWIFVAPACLLFYGLALVNASKYTLSDIRYLGYCEIVLGLVNMFLLAMVYGSGQLVLAYCISFMESLCGRNMKENNKWKV